MKELQYLNFRHRALFCNSKYATKMDNFKCYDGSDEEKNMADMNLQFSGLQLR